jgi:hypothetical protein
VRARAPILQDFRDNLRLKLRAVWYTPAANATDMSMNIASIYHACFVFLLKSACPCEAHDSEIKKRKKKLRRQ